jgi:hypothetical protein
VIAAQLFSAPVNADASVQATAGQPTPTLSDRLSAAQQTIDAGTLQATTGTVAAASPYATYDWGNWQNWDWGNWTNQVPPGWNNWTNLDWGNFLNNWNNSPYKVYSNGVLQ